MQFFFVEKKEKKMLMGGLDGCRGGGGCLRLVVLVSAKPNFVSEKSSQ